MAKVTDKFGVTAILRLADRILKIAALAGGGLTLLFMTGFSFVNVVIMRKVLNNPIKGAEDILILCLVIVVAVSIPFGARTGSHIEIELLESRMSGRFAKWSRIATNLIALAIVILLTWRLWHSGMNAARFGETSQQLLIPFGPFYFVLSVFVGIYALVILLETVLILQNEPVKRLSTDGQKS